MQGKIDAISSDGWISGWALPDAGSGRPSELTIYSDGIPVGHAVADQFREDLIALLPDANCAYWFRLPVTSCDGKSHSISIHVTGTGQQLANSPQIFRLGIESAVGARHPGNMVPNSTFQKWPNGVSTTPTERFSETAGKWFFDYQSGTTPSATFSLAEVRSGSGLPHYGLRLSFQGGIDGYRRLIVPLDASDAGVASLLRFSCGLARPTNAHSGELLVREIFVAILTENVLARVASIRKNIVPRDTIRFEGLLIECAAPPTARLALVFDFHGVGELVIFDPVLSQYPSPTLSNESTDDFEDYNILSQINSIAMSAIWKTRCRLNARLGESDSSTTARRAPVAPRLSGIPFTQILIPVFDAVSDVSDLVSSIIKCTPSPFEILILDDASGLFTADRLVHWTWSDPRIRLVRHMHNMGYTANANYGLHVATAEYVVLMNSDVIVTPGWLEKMHGALESDESTAGVGPLSNAASWQSVPRTKLANGSWSTNRLRDPADLVRYSRLVERLSEAAFPEVPLLNGFCTLFRRAAVAKVGYFDVSSFPTGYGEENDLCVRLTSAGFRLRVADNTFVQHKKSRSFGQERRIQLSRRSIRTFREKHPSVDVAALELEMQSNPVLGRLRSRLLAEDSAETARAPRLYRIAGSNREVSPTSARGEELQ